MPQRTTNSATTPRYRHDGPSAPGRRPPALSGSAPLAAAAPVPLASVAATSTASVRGQGTKAVPRPVVAAGLPVAVAEPTSVVPRHLVELPQVVLRLPEIVASESPQPKARLTGMAVDERMLMAAIAIGLILLSLLFFARRKATGEPDPAAPPDNIAPAWQPEQNLAAPSSVAPAWKEPIAVSPPIAEPSAVGQSAADAGITPAPTAVLPSTPFEPPYPTDGSQVALPDESDSTVGERYREYRTATRPDFREAAPRSSGGAVGGVRLDGIIEKHLPGTSYDRP